MSTAKHPIQPLIVDPPGVLRFKENSLVSALLKHGQKTGLGMNELADMEFSREDREQFAQLIGYSLSGFGELHYSSDITIETAHRMKENPGISEQEAKIAALTDRLDRLTALIKDLAVETFAIHPDDLHT